VDDRDHDGNAETGINERACRLVASIGIGSLTKAKINWHEHQAGAMRDRHGEGPKRQLRRSYPRERPWMTPVEEPEDAETDDQQACASLDLPLQFNKRDEQREG
jgi:hypothetical protein